VIDRSSRVVGQRNCIPLDREREPEWRERLGTMCLPVLSGVVWRVLVYCIAVLRDVRYVILSSKFYEASFVEFVVEVGRLELFEIQW
jgi:hypothetical protein